MAISVLRIALLISLSFFGVKGQSDFDYVGGVPLRTPDETCPAGSVAGEITFEQNCCGAGQDFVKNEISACCANSTDCSNEILAAPKCADPSWQLCGTNDGGFCCEEDWVCYTQAAQSGNGGGVGCSTPGATLAVGQTVVTTVYLANAGPGATTTTPFAAPSTSASATPPRKGAPSTSMSTTVSQSTSLSSTSSSASSSSSVASSQGSSSSPSTDESPGPSLSTGAIVGIAIGGLLLLALGLAGGVWFSKWKSRGSGSNPKRSSIFQNLKMPFARAELGTTGHSRAELQGNLPGSGQTTSYVPLSELPAYQKPVEMYAGYKT